MWELLWKQLCYTDITSKRVKHHSLFQKLNAGTPSFITLLLPQSEQNTIQKLNVTNSCGTSFVTLVSPQSA